MTGNARKNTDGTAVPVVAARALKGRRVLVVGLGATGVSTARFLAKCGAAVTATDTRAASELAGVKELDAFGVAIEAGAHNEQSFRKAELVIVSPGVPFKHPLLEAARSGGAKVISDIELAFLFTDCPTVAIAGTNGKSTVTTLMGQVLRDAGKYVFVGGNLGTPAIEYVESGGGADYCVLEVSSFHLETTEKFNPKVGMLLNITEDHLDRYGSFDEYARTKFRLFKNQDPSDFAIVNAGDPVVAGYLDEGLGGRGNIVRFTSGGTLQQGVYLENDTVIYKSNEAGERYPVAGFSLKGLHNIENIMAVIAAARILGVPRDVILTTLASFKGLGHRMERVRDLGGVTYIDDSKGTNIGALAMALKGLRGPVIVIAGGRDKGGDYMSLAAEVRDKVKLLVLIGEARFKIRDTLGTLTESVMADTMEEAVAAARARAKAGDTVLLCPACSSFDMFTGYKERGERFRAAVEALC